MPRFPIQTNTITSPWHSDETAKQWVFRHIGCYAREPVPGPFGPRNPWSILVVQSNLSDDSWRSLDIGVQFYQNRQPFQFYVMRVYGLPAEPVTDMKFGALRKYIPKKGFDTPQRVEFTHLDMMLSLKDSGIQKELLENVNDLYSFWQNLLEFFVWKQLIAPESRGIFAAKFGTLFQPRIYPELNVEKLVPRRNMVLRGPLKSGTHPGPFRYEYWAQDPNGSHGEVMPQASGSRAVLAPPSRSGVQPARANPPVQISRRGHGAQGRI